MQEQILLPEINPDIPTGIRVEVLGYGRGDGYATVRALSKGLRFETLITRLHKPE